MSSRRDRSKRLFQAPKRQTVVVETRVRRDALQNRVSVGSRELRTISPRTLKIILIALLVLLALWFTAPKPPAPPGSDAQDMSTKSLAPIDLGSVKTTIPPVDTSAESVLGDSFKEKMNLK